MRTLLRISLAAALAPCCALPVAAQNSSYTPPIELSQPPVVYPPLAREKHEEGTTQVDIVVNTDGTVGDAAIAKSSGFPDLDQAALGWVHQWRYNPAVKNGNPVAGTVKANVKWILPDGKVPLGLDADVEKIAMARGDFPSGAWDANENGICDVVLTVDQRGSVVDYRVTKASGFADLDAAARTFLTRNWHITPLMLNGKAARTIIPVEVIWSHDTAAN